MGGQHQTGHLPNEDQKLDSLRPGSRRNGKSSLRRPKLSTKGSSAPGRRKRRRRRRPSGL
jgi:hypothetical protein